MTNTKHTPGPWSAHYNNEGLTVFSPDNVTVAYVDYDECEERPVEANAHLIAAAPAMYEALKDLLGELGDLHDGSISELQCHWCGRCYYDLLSGSLCTSDDCPGYKARAALAQAEGTNR
jgi:hypothetical protein